MRYGEKGATPLETAKFLPVVSPSRREYLMREDLRKYGIDVIGNRYWGTHICQFYQKEEDLIDILTPYFKSGLENNEFCLWITSQLSEIEETKEAWRRDIPYFDTYLENGQIEFISYTHWYLKDGSFDSASTLNGWVEILDQALNNGYDGLRLTEDTFWLKKEDWNDFVNY